MQILEPSFEIGDEGQRPMCASAPRAADATPERAKRALIDMMRIRRFEEAIVHHIDAGHIAGTTHLSIGQEAVAVGACSILEPGDTITSTHRGHGHFLAAGGDPKRIMAELFGRRDGYCAGKGGTQHMAGIDVGFLGSNGIIGGGIPIATGMALAMKMRGQRSLVLCFFGDGAANQGTFHESLNMAAIWKLPAIYLLENNRYAMSSRAADMAGNERLADRAVAYGIASKRVDGNDVAQLWSVMAEAACHVRAGHGPVLVEALTYRLAGHSRNDRCTYRSREEEAYWWARCPIDRLRQRLERSGDLSSDEIDSMERAVAREIDEAVSFATSSPVPSLGEILASPYAAAT